MGNKRRLIDFDSGNHPPPLERFFGALENPEMSDPHSAIFPIRRSELRRNARGTGLFFVTGSIGLFAVVSLTGWAGRFRVGQLTMTVASMVTVIMVAFGVRLLYEVRRVGHDGPDPT